MKPSVSHTELKVKHSNPQTSPAPRRYPSRQNNPRASFDMKNPPDRIDHHAALRLKVPVGVVSPDFVCVRRRAERTIDIIIS
jgi:hypothetical protein